MKINKIFRILPAFVFGLALVACSEGYQYDPAEPEANKTFVSADMTAARSIDADGSAILVPFVRSDANGDLTVDVYLDDPSGLFSLASQSITFASGETTANAAVNYSYDALDAKDTYSFVVGISSNDYLSEYRPAAFPMTCKKAWQNLGICQFYDDWWVGGPFEKLLLKAPDGTETYRLMEPWTKEEVEDGGLDFVRQLPYLEFYIDDEGIITYAERLDMGFDYSGMTCHMLHPSARGDAESAAANCMIMDDVAQFVWYPILAYNNGSFRWWGVTSVAYISFPGGPDLAELLGL